MAHIIPFASVLLFLSTVSAQTTVQLCEDGWVAYNGYCYYIADSAKKASKADALQDCVNRKADLLILEIPEEVDWLTQELAYAKSDGWWTRLYRPMGKTIFQWDDDYPADPAVLQWNLEPDNANGKENCGAINEQTGFSDEDCARKIGFICEVDQAGCPFDWLIANDQCFYISYTFNITQLMTWKQANAKCASMGAGGRLADLSNYDAQDYLKSVLPEQTQTTIPWWTSLNRKNQQWYWGTTPAQNTEDLNWVQEPNNLNGAENCVMLYSNGKLADKDCDRLANYVCKTSDNSIPKAYDGRLGCGSWVRGGEKCYYFENDFAETHAVAQQKCMERGGDLLKIQTEDEKVPLENLGSDEIIDIKHVQCFNIGISTEGFFAAHIPETLKYTPLFGQAVVSSVIWVFNGRNYLAYMTRYNNARYWTQMTAPSSDGEWTFTDGTKPPDGVVVWNIEPNDYSGIQNCVGIFVKQTWDDMSCGVSAGYICEAFSQGQGCPGNWTAFGDSCYFFGPLTTGGTKLSWWMARRVCRNLAEPLVGSLLALDTPEELAFVNSQLTARQNLGLFHWTGLNDIAAEGTLVYDSYDVIPRLDIIPWDIAPSCTTCSPDCSVLLAGGFLADSECTAKNNYVCERTSAGSISSLWSFKTTGSGVLLSVIIVSVLVPSA